MACLVCHKIYSPNDDDNQMDLDEKPNLCTICGLSFTFKIQLKRHLILHADGAPYTCKYCVKDSENKGKTYNLRLGNKSEYSCDVCHKSFSNQRMLFRHSIQHTYESEDGFEEKIKITIKKRVTSQKSKHLSEKNSETEPVKLSLKRHWSYTAPKAKTLVCEVCSKSFAYQACLDKHIRMGKCSLSSSSKASPAYNDEFKDTHEDKSDPSISGSVEVKNNVNEDSEKTDVKKHTCSICGKTFARKSSLDGHELSHILNKETSEDEKYFSDSGEDVSLPKKSRIATFKFQKSFMCDKCNFVCFSKQTLNKHLTNHQEKELQSSEADKDVEVKGKSCENSSKKKPSDKVKSFKDLEKVVGDISYNCEKCDKKFKNETRLLKHDCSKDKTDKTKVKKNSMCEICSENFNSRKELKHHLFSHIEGNTGDSSLDKKELFTKHRMKRSKNFACEICGRRFAGEICLKKHQLKHEHDAKNAEAGTLATPTSRGRKHQLQHEEDGKNAETGAPASSTPRGKKPKPVKELICEYCKEEFTGKRAAYIKHIHAHTPEVCGICDERFVDRESLREHCKIHVGTEEGRMFMQCSQKALDAKNGLNAPEPKVEYIYLVLR